MKISKENHNVLMTELMAACLEYDEDMPIRHAIMISNEYIFDLEHRASNGYIETILKAINKMEEESGFYLDLSKKSPRFLLKEDDYEVVVGRTKEEAMILELQDGKIVAAGADLNPSFFCITDAVESLLIPTLGMSKEDCGEYAIKLYNKMTEDFNLIDEEA